ncbi:apolipoprotein C-II-like [Spea bombifrons]|uniref:apolipoprotein C-II-like n=1 Tax=Spea bombifrons TaxID=233779 RepID=UPI00234BE6CC|nr:apolipoprotein C-II-like [Spea bombifrons]
MNKTQLTAVTLMLLILSTGIESFRIQKREATTYLSQMQDMITNSWEQVTSRAQELIDKARNTELEKKLRDIYEKGTSAIGTYSTIAYDQMYHLLMGQ